MLTSLWEGLPRALVEALRSGLPAVCYATDGVTDILRDGVNGFVVPPRNVTALSEKVVALLDDAKLRGALSAMAADSVGPEFDIDHMVRARLSRLPITFAAPAAVGIFTNSEPSRSR